MPHVAREQAGSLRKVAQAIARAVEDARHGQRVVIPVPAEDTEVGRPQVRRAGGKMEPISGERDACRLRSTTAAWRIRPVVIESYLLLGVIDMHVRGGHMAGKKCLPEWQDSISVDRPGPLQLVTIGKTDILAVVVGKVQVVAPQWLLHPVRDADERRAVDIVAHAVV